MAVEYRFNAYDSANGQGTHGEGLPTQTEEHESDRAAIRAACEYANFLCVEVERKRADGTWESIDIVVPIVKGFGHVGPGEGVSADTPHDDRVAQARQGALIGTTAQRATLEAALVLVRKGGYGDYVGRGTVADLEAMIATMATTD